MEQPSVLVLSGLKSLCLYDSSVQMRLVIHGDWNMETDIRCFCTGPVEVLTEVILADIIACLVLQILYITTVLRRLTPPFCFFEKRRV
ncbi:hypothetical protein E2542_SST04884 [Spatholobus suberectus]|nr:hypothetical protein E2542_SST04884 [Spatholobus suberectus]